MKKFVAGCLFLLAPTFDAYGATPQWEGEITFEGRAFVSSPASLTSTEPTLTAGFGNRTLFGRTDFRFGAWIRVDPLNPDRIRLDAKDIAWLGSAGEVDIAVGLRTVFWGVLESSHLVDVVNQQDPDIRWPRRRMLSQLMIASSWTSSWGTIDVYLLPWARPRPFAGRRGRLWSHHPVDGSVMRNADSSLLRYLSGAARWSLATTQWDIGITYFGGTAREPWFEPSGPAHTPYLLIPTYDRVHQFGGDVQYTGSSWLLKLELVTRDPAPGRYVALGSGVEYAPVDYLSVFLEVLFDSRGRNATTSLEHDTFVGARLLFQDGSVQGGTSIDFNTGNVIASMEIQRRFGNNVAAAFEFRWFAGRALREPPHALREETSVSLFLRRYF